MKIKRIATVIAVSASLLGAMIIVGATPVPAQANWQCTRNHVCLYDGLRGGGQPFQVYGGVARCVNLGNNGWGDRAESWNKMWPGPQLELLDWTGAMWVLLDFRAASETGNWDLPVYARNKADAFSIGGSRDC